MRKEKKRNIFWSVITVICYIIAIGCILALLYIGAERKKSELVAEAAKSDPLRQETVNAPAEEAEEEPQSSDVPETGESVIAPEPVEVPIDFDYLRGINSDIYAWICLGYSDQEYPVLQSSDDEYYLHHGIYGGYSADGALFTESGYNDLSFDEPCTVIYGHNLASGAMFGRLENSASVLDLDKEDDERNYFTVYTQGGIRRYRIVSAGTYSNESILYRNDFSTEKGFQGFFAKLKSYPEGGYKECSDRSPVFGDQLLILSTCHRYHSVHRYLAVAVLVEKQGI